MKKYTDKEFDILKVLWKRGEASVQDVHNDLQTSSGYTTTLKLMQIMFEKKLLLRKKEGKKHIYIPEVDQKEVQDTTITTMVKGLFGGSKLRFAQSFLGNTKPSKEELQAIKEMIQKMEDDAGDSE